MQKTLTFTPRESIVSNLTASTAAQSIVSFQKALAHVAKLGGWVSSVEAVDIRDGVGDEGEADGKEVDLLIQMSCPLYRVGVMVEVAMQLEPSLCGHWAKNDAGVDVFRLYV
jgi:hypothetical protein